MPKLPADDQLKVGFEADEKLAPDGGEMRPGDTTLTTDTAVGGNGVGVSGSRSGVAVGTRVRVGVAVRVRFAVGVGAVVSVGVAFVAVLVTVGVRVVVAGLVIVASTIFWVALGAGIGVFVGAGVSVAAALAIAANAAVAVACMKPACVAGSAARVGVGDAEAEDIKFANNPNPIIMTTTPKPINAVSRRLPRGILSGRILNLPVFCWAFITA